MDIRIGKFFDGEIALEEATINTEFLEQCSKYGCRIFANSSDDGLTARSCQS